MGKPLFGTANFSGGLMVQNPQHSSIISQLGHLIDYSQQQGISSGAAIYAQQQATMNHIQGLQAQMNQMSGIGNIVRGFNGVYDHWFGAKYNKEEIKMAINQEASMVFPLGGSQKIRIKDVDDMHVTIQKNNTNFIGKYSPQVIDSIPFIDKLRKTKFYKMSKS